MSNILVDKDSLEVFIIDYGSSSSFKRQTNAGFTTNYAAPEMFTKDIKTSTNLEKFLGTDVFSLGAIFFELFSSFKYADILELEIKSVLKNRKDIFTEFFSNPNKSTNQATLFVAL